MTTGERACLEKSRIQVICGACSSQVTGTRYARRYGVAGRPAPSQLNEFAPVDNQSEILQELFEFRFNGQRTGNGLRDQ